ncbi:MAG: acyl-CoA dehydrogenase family protein [bacterium]
MNFELPEEYLALKHKVKSFAEKVLKPTALQIDKEGKFPQENLRKLARLGYMGVTVPEEFGGAGMDLMSFLIICEELSPACPSTEIVMRAHNSLACYPILRHGTDKQKKKFLTPLARGEKLGAFALTEAMAGSDVAALQSTARKSGNKYILNGTKTFITSASIADTYIIFAKTDPGKKHRGIGAFIIDKNAKGLSFGKKIEVMGFCGSHTGEIFMDNVEVPQENVLGGEGAGFRIAMDTVVHGRLGMAAAALGMARESYELALDYATRREAFGQPIGKFQGVQWKLADIYVNLEAAHLLLYKAAWMSEKVERNTLASAVAKLFATEMAVNAASEAMQIFGGYGYSKEYPIELYYRALKLFEIAEGSSEIQRMIIAKEIGLPM